MTTTFIKSGECKRVRVPGAGEAAEIANKALCGASNVLATLRWLQSGDQLKAAPQQATHELVYVMEGDAVISLNGQNVPVKKGGGVYVGPKESAVISPAAAGTLKLFHLVVPEVAD